MPTCLPCSRRHIRDCCTPQRHCSHHAVASQRDPVWDTRRYHRDILYPGGDKECDGRAS
jgi:hypothetical protein